MRKKLARQKTPEELEAARIAATAKQAKLNRRFYDVLGESGAPEIMEHLAMRFAKRTMVKRVNDVVDVNATLVQCGAYEVLTVIKEYIELGAKGK